MYVQPRASANAVAGLHENSLKIRLTAPPVDNAANRMCMRFLSRILGISASRVEIVSGHGSRKKKVLIRFPEGRDPKTAGREITEKLNHLSRGG